MSIETEAFQAVFGFVEGWASKNQQLFPAEVRRKNIRQTGDLEGSFRFGSRKGGDRITIDQYFDTSGRFVDMGVGRGMSIEDRAGRAMAMDEMTGRRKKGRKRKPWMRALYGRLNALEGAVGMRMMEKAVEAVKAVKS